MSGEAEVINVRRILNPFKPSDAVVETWNFVPGKTVGEYLAGPFVSEYVISRNGQIISPEDYDKSYLSEGDSVVVCPVPLGGDDSGKSILRIIAMVVVSYFTLGAGGMGSGGWISSTFGTGMGGWAAAGVAYAAGAMLVSALLPPASSDSTSDGLDKSASYGFDGPKNTSTEGVAVPVCYGEFRMGGNLIGIHTENRENTQDLYMLINAGEGPIGGIDSIEVNGTDYKNFQDVAIEQRLGYTDQTAIEWFAKTLVPVNKGVKITDDVYTTFTTVDQVEGVRLDFVCPGGLGKVDKKTGKLSERSVAMLVDYRLQGDPSWIPMSSTSVSSIGYSVLPVMGEGEIYTSSLEGYGYSGNLGDSVVGDIGFYIATFEIHNDAAPGEAIPANVEVEIRAELESLIGKPAHYWSGRFEWAGESGIYDYSRPLPLIIEKSTTHTGSLCAMTGESRSAVRKSFYSETLARGRYEFRIKKTWDFVIAGSMENGGEITAYSTGAGGGQSLPDDYTLDEVYLSDVNEITLTEAIAYKNTALLAMKIKMGDQISGMPTVTFINRGKVVRTLRRETGGRLVQHLEPSNNPAWILLDMATNFRYGAGIRDDRIDISSIIEWADYCDENNLVFNGVIDTNINFWDVAQYVLRVGHAQLVNVGTKFYIAIERASSPVMMFGMGNIIESTFKQTWLSTSERANEVDVTFFDKLDGYKQKTVKVTDTSAATSGEVQRTSAITLYGVDNAQTAYKEGAFQLNLNKYILQTVEFQAPIESIACTVGDVIYVQHDMPSWGASGRLEVGSTASSINLDKTVTMEAGKTYKLLLIRDTMLRATRMASYVSGNFIGMNALPSERITRLRVGTNEVAITGVADDGVYVSSVTGIFAGSTCELLDVDVIEERDVLLSLGDHDTITLQGPLSFVPAQYTNYMFGESAKVKKKFRIKSITTTMNDLSRQISAVEYDENVYDLSRYGTLPDDVTLDPNPGSIGQVGSLNMLEETYIAGSRSMSRAVAYWTVPSSGHYAGADVIITINNGTPTTTIINSRTHIEIGGNKGDVISIKVVAFDINGVRTAVAGAPTALVTLYGSSGIEVGDVTGVEYVWGGRDCRLSWRYNAGSASYEFGSEIAGADSGALDPQFKDYEIKVYRPKQDGELSALLLRTEHTVDPFYTYTYEKNSFDGLNRHLIFEIRMRDQMNNLGAIATVDAQNIAPSILWSTAEGNFDGAVISFEPSDDLDYAGAVVFMSETLTDISGDIDTISSNFRIYDGPDRQVQVRNLMPITTYYYRIAPYDVFGFTELIPTVPLSFVTTYLDIEAIAIGIVGISQLSLELQESIKKIDYVVPDSINSRIDTALQTALTSIISESELRQTETDSLAQRIDGVEATTNDNTAAVLTEVTARTTADDALGQRVDVVVAQSGANTAAIVTESIARANADTALTTRVDVLVARTDDNEAVIAVEQTARTTADSALANQLSVLQARLDTGGDIANAIIATQDDVETALHRPITYVQATAPASPLGGDLWVDTANGNIIKSWNGTGWITLSASDGGTTTYFQANQPTASVVGDLWIDTANGNAVKYWDGTSWLNAASQEGNRTFMQGTIPAATMTGDLWIDTANGNTVKRWDGTAWVSASDAYKNRTFMQGSAPTATAVGDLWINTADNNKIKRWNGAAWVDASDGQITAIASSVTTLQTTVNGHTASIATSAASINGLEAKYTVKIDVNGYVSGFGLASSANNGVPTSEFIIRADKFAIITPGYDGTHPFTIGMVDGVMKTVIASALIGDAAINNAKIADAAITSAKISNAQIQNAHIENLTVNKEKFSNYIITTGSGTGTLLSSNDDGSSNYSLTVNTGSARYPLVGAHSSVTSIISGISTAIGSFTVYVRSFGLPTISYSYL